MQSFPINPHLLQEIDRLSSTQLAWLSGYTWAKSQAMSVPAAATATVLPSRNITILSASQTGNAKGVAKKLLGSLESAKLPVNLVDTGDYKIKNIGNEDIVLLVTSTQGEGDPPEEAIPLFKFLYGKKAPDLSKLSYAVLALGDSSYPDFCEAGKMFDSKLADLGAKRLTPRVDCDIDFETPSSRWIESITSQLTELIPETNADSSHTTNIPATNLTLAETGMTYSKDEPYVATLSVRQKITSRDANKDVEHIEIDITDSNMRYQPGDSLGVWFSNDPVLVDNILEACQLSGDEMIKLEDDSQVSIRQALLELDEITQNSPQFIKGLAAIALDEELLHIASDPTKIQNLVDTQPILSLLKKYPTAIYAQTLHNFFRPLTPRFYSIASSQLEVSDEVHLTVGVVRYEHENIIYTGGASGFLGERLQEGDTLKVFVEPNPKFRLPQDISKPIIMIGSGTGIAPFRAFMQERENTDSTGKNWLIFGNQKFTDDFLYQLEWQDWHKQGLLTRFSLAWSRQKMDKEYVQHKIQEDAEEFWQWLQAGAHIYVCGDATKMAKDVELILLQLIQNKGNLSEDDAEEYLNELRMADRYQRDVY